MQSRGQGAEKAFVRVCIWINWLDKALKNISLSHSYYFLSAINLRLPRSLSHECEPVFTSLTLMSHSALAKYPKKTVCILEEYIRVN